MENKINNSKEYISDLLEKTKGFSAEQILQFAYAEFKGKVVLASSLGEEDQILTDMISKVQPKINIFTLDTGRLFAEAYDLIHKTQQRYPMEFTIFYPQTAAVEAMVKDKGINLFYESVDNRKLCCGIRKVEPLQRALKGVDAWITGLRKAQSITRSTVQTFEWDEQNQKIKVNPLADWSLKNVEEYVQNNNVDINPLHKNGFKSIGCAPCTRAIKPGEDIRDGRWWWEQPQQKECGLHNNPNRPNKK